jgi:hypothetical protein
MLAPRRPITMAERNAVTGVLRCSRCDAMLCYGVTVTLQQSLGVARSSAFTSISQDAATMRCKL